MSETPNTPKKPRKKAAAKGESPKRDDAARADASADAQKKRKEAVLLAALPQAAFDGFTDSVLRKAAEASGVDKTEQTRLFENGPVSLVEYFSHWADAGMEQRLAAMDLKAMKIRARIAAGVLARLDTLKDHKEAARRAAALLSLPMHTGVGAKLVYATVDAMWRAAGDTSTDFNFYTKRGILAGVYGATAVRWFNDTSENEQATHDFLAARIENVMQFESFKAKAKQALSGLPAFADWAKTRSNKADKA